MIALQAGSLIWVRMRIIEQATPGVTGEINAISAISLPGSKYPFNETSVSRVISNVIMMQSSPLVTIVNTLEDDNPASPLLFKNILRISICSAIAALS